MVHVEHQTRPPLPARKPLSVYGSARRRRWKALSASRAAPAGPEHAAERADADPRDDDDLADRQSHNERAARLGMEER